MIRSIRLLNWRSHQDSILQFGKGTNLLVGIMGSGKSSVLDAISFALFGTFPALERRKLKLEDVVRLNESEAKVVLEFDWDGAQYRVERTLAKSKRGTSSNSSFFKDNLMLESGTRAVTQYIVQLLGADYELFTRAIYSEQNNIDYFLNLDPRRRKQEIDSLLGLDRFEDARTNIVSVINRVRSARKLLEGRFSRERLAEQEDKGRELQAKLEGLRARAKDTAESAVREKARLEIAEKTFNGLREKKTLFEMLAKEHARLSGSLQSLKKELGEREIDEEKLASEKKVLEESQSRRSALLSASREHGTLHSSLSKDAGQLESQIKSLMDDAKRLASLKEALSRNLDGKSPEELESEASSVDKELISLNAEKSSVQLRIKEAGEALATLKPGSSECPLCGNELTEQHIRGISEEKNTFISSGQERVKQIELALPLKKTNREKLLSRIRDAEISKQRIARLEQEQARLPELKEKRTSLESKLLAAQTAKLEAQKKADELSGEMEKLLVSVNTFESLLRKKKELSSLEQQLARTESSMREIRFDERAFESGRADIERLRLLCQKLSSDGQAITRELSDSEQMLSLVKKELDNLRKTEGQIRSREGLENELTIFKNALLETQISLRASLTDAINSAMNEVWRIFYPYKNYPSLRLGVTEKDYLFQVSDGSVWKSLESVASGGERASAALTLRVALAMVLTPKLSWLILDEPTHNLDREAVTLLSETLQLKVPQVVNQTFVITHEEALTGSDFASSYKLDRDKGRDGPTKTEKM